MTKTRVLLIDQMNLFLRCFSALPFMNDDGDHVGALFGCLNSYSSLINNFEPDIVLIAWEGKNSSKRRRDLMPEYKEGRKFGGFNKRVFGDDIGAEQAALKNQLNKLKEYITALPFHQLSVDFLEADDVIGYASQFVFNDADTFENIIVSYDRDYYQLVNNATFLFRPIKTKEYPKGRFLTTEGVIEETGCHPSNYLISKCLVGDNSDAITGISGVGQKTVAKDFPCLRSLKTSGDIYSISDILDISEYKISQEKQKKYGKYLANRNLIERNHKLMQLLDPDISAAAMQTIERTFTNFTPKFKKTKFRIMLLRDCISPKNIQRWVDAFTNVSPKSISTE